MKFARMATIAVLGMSFVGAGAVMASPPEHGKTKVHAKATHKKASTKKHAKAHTQHAAKKHHKTSKPT